MPTALDALGLAIPDHLLEGMPLTPLLRGAPNPAWREVAVSEIDYSFREARLALKRDKRHCRGYMVRSARWKFIYWEGFRAQLFDLENDPQELVDRYDDPALEPVRAEHLDALFQWMRHRKLSVTLPDSSIVVSRHVIEPKYGIKIGVW